MKLTKKVIEERERVVKTICDICGKDTQADETGQYNMVAVNPLRAEWGEAWPEVRTMKEVEVDICLACFRGKLIPWLKEQGAVVGVSEVERVY